MQVQSMLMQVQSMQVHQNEMLCVRTTVARPRGQMIGQSQTLTSRKCVAMMPRRRVDLATTLKKYRSNLLTSCKRLYSRRFRTSRKVISQSLFLPIPPTQGIYISFGDGTAPDRLQIAAFATDALPIIFRWGHLPPVLGPGLRLRPPDRYSLSASL